MRSRLQKNITLAITRACTLAAMIGVLGVAGCSGRAGNVWKQEAAQRIAVPANLLKRQVAADPFSITVFERIHAEGQMATVYIEGDGQSLLGKTTPSLNPTPDYPVGLHMASRDLAENVIYIARPCQYSGMIDTKTACPKEYWTDRRFALEVMQSMNTVLDKIKSRYDIRGFHLVGYDGGAAVATMLTAKRDDVLTLRTVAGNLDHVAYNNNHKQPPMPGSLNPLDFAKDIADVPQHHFVGAWDDVVTRSVYDSFRSAMGASSCVRMSVVDEVNHEDGWVNRWPSLLTQPVDCSAAP
jgi:hypothetical protein